MSLLVLSSNDVDALASAFSLEELQLLMARVFSRLSHSSNHSCRTKDPGVFIPPRINIPMTNHTALFMPARLGPPGAPAVESTSSASEVVTNSANLNSTPGDTAIKVVSVPKQSGIHGLPATTLVLDEVTGRVKAIVNARKLTALRNAAGAPLYFRNL
jgi:ornithine cyclodeaminase